MNFKEFLFEADSLNESVKPYKVFDDWKDAKKADEDAIGEYCTFYRDEHGPQLSFAEIMDKVTKDGVKFGMIKTPHGHRMANWSKPDYSDMQFYDEDDHWQDVP